MPLPAHPFETDVMRTVVSGKTPYVRFDRNSYSIPHTSFVLRTDAEDRIPTLLTAVRATLEHGGVQLAVQEMTTMESVVDLSVGAAGQIVTLLSLLAGLALVLGAVGGSRSACSPRASSVR